LDENGVILETNKAWRDFALKSGIPENHDDRGRNYLAICEATIGSDADDAGKVAEGIRAVIRGEVEEFLYDYPCHSEDGPHWYYMRAILMAGDGLVRVVASHEEITALKLTEEALKKSQEELIEQKQSLEETNIAMKVLLKQREEDKLDLEKKVLSNVKDLVLPYVEKLKNPRLSETIVQDLNLNSELSLESNSFDAVVCTVSIEYLIDPLAVFVEVSRVLRPDGYFIVAFSNRWFPTKAIKIWQELHEFERMGMILEYFLRSGGFKNLQIYSIRGLPRPHDDKYFPDLWYADPIYAVWGQKR
jgi:SAM-dependent methyltransferase